MPDVKALLAVMVILGSFGLTGIYVWRGQAPDATVVALITLPLGAVVGFFFGHTNGTATALAHAATDLAVSVRERRLIDFLNRADVTTESPK